MKLRGYFFFLILFNLTFKHFTLVTILSFLTFCDILYGRLYYWLKIFPASNFAMVHCGWSILPCSALLWAWPWTCTGQWRVNWTDNWSVQRQTLLFALSHSSPQPYKENAQGSLFTISLSPEWETHGVDMNTIHSLDLSCQSQLQFSSVQFSRSVMSDSLRPHESQHTRPPCPSPTPRVHSNSRPSGQWCHPAISSSVVPFSSCPNPSQHQSLFQWVNSSHEVAKVLEFQL